MKGNVAVAIFLFLCLITTPLINAAVDIQYNTIDDDTGGNSHPSGG